MRKPPILKSGRVLGHTPGFAADPLGSFDHVVAAFPDEEVVRLRFGPFVDYVVIGADAAREILLGGHDDLVRPWFFNRVFKEIAGLNLFTANGDEWRSRRKMIGPAFHSGEIAGMADTMVEVAERFSASVEEGQNVDLREMMASLTLEVAGRVLFGVDVNAAGRGRRLAEAFEGMIRWSNYRFGRFLTEPVWAPTRRASRARGAIRVLDEIASEVVAERRKRAHAQHDLLQLLLDSRTEGGEPLADEEVVSEAKAFFFAGHETTASALAWTWYELARNPEVESALLAELNLVLGGRSPKLSDLEELELTRRVVEEAMRLHPPAMALTRRTHGPVNAAGYRIPSNRGVLILVYAIHRHPKYWEKSGVFDPGRFTPAGSAGRPAHAFIPFGEGPRMCIGSRFAMTEARLVLATMAQRWRFVVDDPGAVPADTRFVLKPALLPVRVAGHRR